MASDQEEAEAKRAAVTVGELILTASALDHQLNRICISVLALVDSPMLESVVATLDSARKVEIIKAYAGKLTTPDWKKGIKDHAESVEAVNRVRNVAAHGVMAFANGKAVLRMPAAARLLKSIDLKNKTAEKIDLTRLEAATKRAQVALGNGIKLLAAFDRVAVERARRNAARK